MEKVQKERKAPLYGNETGKLPCRLANDYMFRAVLQENNQVLKYLICSMKHLEPEEVKSAVIMNPILLGTAIDDRTFILDVEVEMDSGDIINFEMQTYAMSGWEERSLLYLCRAFDGLQQGEKYESAKAVTQIGFLDYTLFPEVPEFYATYKIINIKNHHIYTDKFTLSVVDLNRIDLATDEDKKWHIDTLALLFKATTWEEIKMLAEKDEMVQEAADTMYRLSQDRVIREQCRAREDYDRQMNYYERKMKELAGKDATLEKLEEVISSKDRELEKVEEALLSKDRELEKIGEALSSKDRELEKIGEALSSKDKELNEKDAEIARLKKLLEEKD